MLDERLRISALGQRVGKLLLDADGSKEWIAAVGSCQGLLNCWDLARRRVVVEVGSCRLYGASRDRAPEAALL